MRTGIIRQTVTLGASPHDAYEALMDSRKHSQFTGCVAKISRRAGGRFTAMESLRGKNVELRPDRKIVQTWQCDLDGWPKDHFSVLTITLHPVRSGTRLNFRQTGVPMVCARKIAASWTKYYWRPLKRMLKRA